jgi:hypothetical protein
MFHAGWGEFDGDSTFALDVHGVEELCLHVAFLNGSGNFKKSVRKGRFSVVNMGDDAEIANVVHKWGDYTEGLQNNQVFSQK